MPYIVQTFLQQTDPINVVEASLYPLEFCLVDGETQTSTDLAKRLVIMFYVLIHKRSQ